MYAFIAAGPMGGLPRTHAAVLSVGLTKPGRHCRQSGLENAGHGDDSSCFERGAMMMGEATREDEDSSLLLLRDIITVSGMIEGTGIEGSATACSCMAVPSTDTTLPLPAMMVRCVHRSVSEAKVTLPGGHGQQTPARTSSRPAMAGRGGR